MLPTRPGDSPLKEGHGTGRVSGAKAQGFEEALAISHGTGHPGYFDSCERCIALRAAHAAEVEEAARRGAAAGMENLVRKVEESRAAGVAEGRRQMAREALEQWMKLRPVPRPDTSLISIFFEWLSEQADGGKIRSCPIVGCHLPEPHTHTGGTQKAAQSREEADNG